MSFNALKPRKFSQDEIKKVAEAAQAQQIQRGTPKSFDPVNFPVFTLPAEKKLLIYVPNHVEETADGFEVRNDHAYYHTIQDGRTFRKIRSLSGLDLEGYSGNCPMQEAVSDCFELANLRIDRELRARGLNGADGENQDVRDIKRNNYQKNVISNINEAWTFPIAVFEYSEDGRSIDPEYKLYWLVAGKSVWDKLHTVVDAGDFDNPEDATIAGKIFVYNALKVTSLRDAPRNAAFLLKDRAKFDQDLLKKIDNETVEWNQEKSIETVIQNAYFPEEDLISYIEDLMAPVRQQIEVLKAEGDHTRGTDTDTEGDLVLSDETDEMPALEATNRDIGLDDEDEMVLK